MQWRERTIYPSHRSWIPLSSTPRLSSSLIWITAKSFFFRWRIVSSFTLYLGHYLALASIHNMLIGWQIYSSKVFIVWQLPFATICLPSTLLYPPSCPSSPIQTTAIGRLLPSSFLLEVAIGHLNKKLEGRRRVRVFCTLASSLQNHLSGCISH